VNNWVSLDVSHVEDLHQDIDERVHLLYAQKFEMLVDEEEFSLVVCFCLQGIYEHVHVGVGDVIFAQMPQVNVEGYLHGVILDGQHEQLFELLVGDLRGIRRQKVLVVVLLRIHFKHLMDLVSSNQEPLSVVKCNSFVNSVVNQQLLKEGLVVLSVGPGLQSFLLAIFSKSFDSEFSGELLERNPYQVIIPGLEQMKSISVSHLYEFQFPEDLGVTDSQVVIDSLIKDHVINLGVDVLAHCPEPIESMVIDVLQHQVYHFMLLSKSDFLDQSLQKCDNVAVFVVNAEIEAVENGHGLVFNVV
jgi:hypothetical protein